MVELFFFLRRMSYQSDDDDDENNNNHNECKKSQIKSPPLCMWCIVHMQDIFIVIFDSSPVAHFHQWLLWSSFPVVAVTLKHKTSL